MSVPTRPAKDAAFFAEIAGTSDWMVVGLAMTIAARKNFGSLNGLVDFLMASGREVDALMKNTQYHTSVPKSPTDTTSALVKRSDSTLTMAFATAFGVQDAEGAMSREASPPEAIALAKRVGELYNAPFGKTHALLLNLDQLLQDSASRVADPRIVKILVDAGASPDQKHPSAQNNTAAKTSPLQEAIYVKNWEAAMQLVALMQPQTVEMFVDVLIASKGKNGTTSAQAFGTALGIPEIVSGLREKPAQVDDLLRAIDAKVLEAEGKGALKMIARFRMQLAATFLQEIAKTYSTNPTDDEMAVLLGKPGDATHTGVKDLLDAFARKKNPEPVDGNPDPDKWKCNTAKSNPCQYEEVEADFLYQALRTHCVQGITISKEVMVAAERGRGPGPQHAVDGKLIDMEDSDTRFTLNSDSFRKTLKVLQEAGWDLNALPEGNNALHVLAATNAEKMFDMLPTLLDFGVEDDADDQHSEVPIGKIAGLNEDQWVERWDSIVKSHAARKSARSLIDEIEMEEKEPKRPAP